MEAVRAEERCPNVLSPRTDEASRQRGEMILLRVSQELDLALRHRLWEVVCAGRTVEEYPAAHEQWQRLKRLVASLQAGAKLAAEGKLPGPASAWLEKLAREQSWNVTELRRNVFATPHYWSRLAQLIDPEEFERSRESLHLGYGYAALAAGNFELAKTRFTEAQKANARSAAVEVAWADVWSAQQRPDAAIEHLRQAFLCGTTNARALNDFAWLEATLEHERAADLDLAREAAERAAAMAPVGNVWDTLAEVRFRQGELGAAFAAAVQAVANAPTNETYRQRFALYANMLDQRFFAAGHTLAGAALDTESDELDVCDDESSIASPLEGALDWPDGEFPSATLDDFDVDEESANGSAASTEPPRVSFSERPARRPIVDDDRPLDFDFDDEPAPSMRAKPAPATPARSASGDEDDGLIDIFEHPAELATVVATVTGDFGESPPKQHDVVECSAFAPPFAAAGEPFLTQVFAHLPEGAGEAAEQAREADADASRRGRTALATRIARGSKLSFEVNCKHAEIDEPFQRMTWQGATQCVSFYITPPNHACPPLPVKITVIQDRVPIGQIRFMLPVKVGAAPSSDRAIVGEATRYRTAFASYASNDRPEVARRVQMLRLAGIKCFQDVLDLEPGDRWQQELWRRIDQADVLFLFWSPHARDSEWVEREWKYGLKQRGLDFIRPVVLQRKPLVEPPAELADLHFNDRILSLIDDAL